MKVFAVKISGSDYDYVDTAVLIDVLNETFPNADLEVKLERETNEE